MPLFRRRRVEVVDAHTPLHVPGSKGQGGEGNRFTSKSELHALLKRQLAICAARCETGEFDVVDVGLLIQAHVSHTGSYAQWRVYWQRCFQNTPYDILDNGTWAGQLPDDGVSVLLLPVKPGTTSMTPAPPPAQSRQTPRSRSAGSKRLLPPQLIARPMEAHAAKLPPDRTPEVLGIDVLCSWLEGTPDDIAPRLSPPLFTYMRSNGRHVLKRSALTWDLAWPLPPPSTAA